MPLLTPPDDYAIYPDELELPSPELTAEQIWWRNRHVQLYLDVPNWKCLECGATMFGRVEYCVYCKFRLGKHTPRPKGEAEWTTTPTT